MLGTSSSAARASGAARSSTSAVAVSRDGGIAGSSAAWPRARRASGALGPSAPIAGRTRAGRLTVWRKPTGGSGSGGPWRIRSVWGIAAALQPPIGVAYRSLRGRRRRPLLGRPGAPGQSRPLVLWGLAGWSQRARTWRIRSTWGITAALRIRVGYSSLRRRRHPSPRRPAMPGWSQLLRRCPRWSSRRSPSSGSWWRGPRCWPEPVGAWAPRRPAPSAIGAGASCASSRSASGGDGSVADSIRRGERRTPPRAEGRR